MDERPAQEEQVWQPSQRSKNSSKNGGKGYRHTTGSATPAPARTRGSRAATGKPSEMEEDMLDFAFDVRDESRLCCQIKISPQLDGLVVRVPAKQF